MRVNTRRTLDAWRQRKSLRIADSIWTNGDHIYSYATCLVVRKGDDVVINMTRYSNTTTRHQNAIRRELAYLCGYARLFIVDDLPRGVDADDLCKAGAK